MMRWIFNLETWLRSKYYTLAGLYTRVHRNKGWSLHPHLSGAAFPCTITTSNGVSGNKIHVQI